MIYTYLWLTYVHMYRYLLGIIGVVHSVGMDYLWIPIGVNVDTLGVS